MDDQLDNDLKKRITEVFENHEDTSADEGWLLLREKFPEKAKRRIAAWIWWAPAAAILLIFLGILWFRTTPEKPQHTIASAKAAQHGAVPKTAEKNTTVDRNTTAGSKLVTQQTGQSIANNIQKSQASSGLTQPKSADNKRNRKIAAPLNPGQETVAANKPTHNIQPTNNQATTPPQNNAQDQNALSSKNSLAVTGNQKNDALVPLASVAKTDSANIASPKSVATTDNQDVNMLAHQGDKTKPNIFADNSMKSQKTEKSLKGDKAIRFGVYATTYFNYSKGSSSQFNVGGGITSDIKLTRNFKLSTGISIGQNTLNYASQPTLSTPTYPASFYAVSNYVPASLDLIHEPSFRNYSANLVGLDIPLNLKFLINPAKNETYVLAGLSSGTFINETYTYSYNNPSLYSANISQVQDQSVRNSFNGFYFAKTLNLGFGTGYVVGGNWLIIEPFLKYPLEGLGTQQIKFGSGGINLKFNFQPSKR